MALFADMTDFSPASEGSSQTNPDLKESAELLEIAHDAIIVRDPASRIRYWNHGAQETYGWTSEEALGKVTHSFLQTKFPISLQAVDGQLVNVGTWEGELAHTTRDGQRIVVLSRQVLRRDETGKPSAILEINRDITARKKIEEALQQSDQRFRLLVDNVRDYAIFMLDPEGRVASWNEGAERLKGYRAEEIIGQHFSRFYPQEDIEKGKPEHELRVAATDGRHEDEGWRVRKDGSRFWANVMITALRDAEGRLVGFSKITRDFTERRKAEEAVRLSEERFRSLFEFSPDAIMVIDGQGKITETNGQVSEILRLWPWRTRGSNHRMPGPGAIQENPSRLPSGIQCASPDPANGCRSRAFWAPQGRH